MKKIVIVLSALTVLTLPLTAQEAPKPAKKPAALNTSTSPTEGKLGYISDKKITVKAKGAEASTAFNLDAETKVSLNGETKTAADLKRGWTAKVTPKATDVTTAATIEITKAEAPVKKDAKPEATE